MNTQINLRLPEKLLVSVRNYAENHGYGTVQDFIKETVRERLFDKPELKPEELVLVSRLADVSEKKNLYGTEEELFRRLKKRQR